VRVLAGSPCRGSGAIRCSLSRAWLLTPLGVGYADRRLAFAIPVATFVAGFIAGLIFTKRKTS